MNAEITSIPEMLIKTRGNQAAVAEILHCSMVTVYKYARDYNAERHAVINGRLMSAFGERGKNRWAGVRNERP